MISFRTRKKNHDPDNISMAVSIFPCTMFKISKARFRSKPIISNWSAWSSYWPALLAVAGRLELIAPERAAPMLVPNSAPAISVSPLERFLRRKWWGEWNAITQVTCRSRSCVEHSATLETAWIQMLCSSLSPSLPRTKSEGPEGEAETKKNWEVHTCNSPHHYEKTTGLGEWPSTQWDESRRWSAWRSASATSIGDYLELPSRAEGLVVRGIQMYFERLKRLWSVHTVFYWKISLEKRVGLLGKCGAIDTDLRRNQLG